VDMFLVIDFSNGDRLYRDLHPSNFRQIQRDLCIPRGARNKDRQTKRQPVSNLSRRHSFWVYEQIEIAASQREADGNAGSPEESESKDTASASPNRLVAKRYGEIRGKDRGARKGY